MKFFKNFKKYLLNTLALIVFLFGLIRGLMFFYVRNKIGGEYYDGLGNKLETVPTLLKMVYINDSLWAGGWLFFKESLICVLLIGIAWVLFSIAND